MNETTITTTNATLTRADLLAWLNERLSDPVARSSGRNTIRDVGDVVVEAKRITEAAAAHDKG